MYVSFFFKKPICLYLLIKITSLYNWNWFLLFFFQLEMEHFILKCWYQVWQPVLSSVKAVKQLHNCRRILEHVSRCPNPTIFIQVNRKKSTLSLSLFFLIEDYVISDDDIEYRLQCSASLSRWRLINRRIMIIPCY